MLPSTKPIGTAQRPFNSNRLTANRCRPTDPPGKTRPIDNAVATSFNAGASPVGEPEGGHVTDRQDNHLNLLSVFHYVVGALVMLSGCLPGLYLGMGVVLLAASFDKSSKDAPPALMGVIFILLFGVFMIIILAMGVLVLIVGRKLAQRRGYMFCFVIAAIECLWVPWGTVLGVFTIVVLAGPSVRQKFEIDDKGGANVPAAP